MFEKKWEEPGGQKWQWGIETSHIYNPKHCWYQTVTLFQPAFPGQLQPNRQLIL